MHIGRLGRPPRLAFERFDSTASAGRLHVAALLDRLRLERVLERLDITLSWRAAVSGRIDPLYRQTAIGLGLGLLIAVLVSSGLWAMLPRASGPGAPGLVLIPPALQAPVGSFEGPVASGAPVDEAIAGETGATTNGPTTPGTPGGAMTPATGGGTSPGARGPDVTSGAAFPPVGVGPAGTYTPGKPGGPTPPPPTQLPGGAPPPTGAPTPAPTPADTPTPPRPPTPDPTPADTPAPTRAPTPEPTPEDTPAPTPDPTRPPTPEPTPDPTPEPTPDPTPEPTPTPEECLVDLPVLPPICL